MNTKRISSRRSAVTLGLGVVLTALSLPVLAAGGAPTRFTAGVWSTPDVGSATVRAADGVETAEFARLEIAPANNAPAGKPLTKGASPFAFDAR